MGLLRCDQDGGHDVRVAFKPSPGERYCPEHGTPLRPRQMKRGSGFRAQDESPARRAARLAFNRAVLQFRCFYSAYRSRTRKPRRKGHVCSYPLDAHHLIEKQWIESNYSDLTEEQLLAILFDPRIG